MKKTNTGSSAILYDRSDKQVEAIAIIICAICLVLAVVPIVHIIAKSFSKGTAVIAGAVTLWPINPQIDGFKHILTETDFVRALFNTIFATITGTALSMLVSIGLAYPLSKSDFRGKKPLTLLCIVIMVFSGGMVPNYLIMKSLKLLNTWAALIIPNCLNVFNMLIIKNYFENLPEGVMESASIDGANDIKTLVRIVCPMSVPVLATVAMLYAVHYWNNYFNAMLYINNPQMITMQVFIRDFIANAGTIIDQLERTEETMGNLSTGVIIACTTVLGIIPIVAVYPFVQKFMLQGITIGSEKG